MLREHQVELMKEGPMHAPGGASGGVDQSFTVAKMQVLIREFAAGHFQLVTFVGTAVIEVQDIHSMDHTGTEIVHTGLRFNLESYRSFPVESLTLEEPMKKGLQVDSTHDDSRTCVSLLA